MSCWRLGHTHTQDHVKTKWEDCHLQAKKRRPEKKPTRPTPYSDLYFLAFRIVRKFFVVI